MVICSAHRSDRHGRLLFQTRFNFHKPHEELRVSLPSALLADVQRRVEHLAPLPEVGHSPAECFR